MYIPISTTFVIKCKLKGPKLCNLRPIYNYFDANVKFSDIKSWILQNKFVETNKEIIRSSVHLSSLVPK